MAEESKIMFNKELKATFNDGDLVVLIKDCSTYGETPSEFNPIDQFFKKDCVVGVVCCGCSKFIIKDGVIVFTDNEEWCQVETILEDYEGVEEGFEDFPGVIRALHLRKCESKDLERFRT